MRASPSSCSLAVLAAAATLLTALPSRAQGAPQPQPAGGWAPYAAPYRAPQPWEVPGPKAETRSPNMVIAGAVLIAVGSVGAVVGASLMAAGTDYTFNCNEVTFECTRELKSQGKLSAGIAFTAIGTTALAIGIPLLAIGRQKVALRPETALVPEVRVGAGGGTLKWTF